MRPALLYNPRLLCERLALASINRRRIGRLQNTPAQGLSLGHIDSLELLELTRSANVRVIYDIGANVGTWSLLAKAMIPDAHIHAFEPLPKHHKAFVEHMEGIENITLHRIALGSENNEALLHVTDFSDASSMLRPAAAAEAHFGIREVDQHATRVHRLDDYRASQQLSWPDLIKLDVQGYELEALKGGKQCLMSAKAVLVEVSFVEFYQGQPLFEEIVGFMAGSGFRLHAMSATTPVGKPLFQTDVLFMASSG